MAYQACKQFRCPGIQPAEESALAYGRQDAAAVDFLDDKRHCKHRRRTHLFEGRNQHCGSRRLLYIYYLGAPGKRVEHTYAHLVGVRHREYGEEYVPLVHMVGVPGCGDVLAEVPVAEHHALGGSGGAGGVDNRREVVRLRVGNLPVAGVFFVFLPQYAQVVRAYYQLHSGKDLFADLRKQLPRHEEHL